MPPYEHDMIITSSSRDLSHLVPSEFVFFQRIATTFIILILNQSRMVQQYVLSFLANSFNDTFRRPQFRLSRSQLNLQSWLIQRLHPRRNVALTSKDEP